MMRKPLHILSNERGASVIELALAAPLLAAFLIGMVDLSRAYSMKLGTEQAAQRIMEKVQRDGFTPGTEATLKAEAEAAAGSTAVATVTSSLECTSGGTTTSYAFTAACPTAGAAYARYVTITIAKTYTPFFSFKWDRTASSDVTVRGGASIRVQ